MSTPVSKDIVWSNGDLSMQYIEDGERACLNILYTDASALEADNQADYKAWLDAFKDTTFRELYVSLDRDHEVAEQDRPKVLQIVQDVSRALMGRVLDAVHYTLGENVAFPNMKAPYFECKRLVVEQTGQGQRPEIVGDVIGFLMDYSPCLEEVDLACSISVVTKALAAFPTVCKVLRVTPTGTNKTPDMHKFVSVLVSLLTRENTGLERFELDMQKENDWHTWYSFAYALRGCEERDAKKRKADFVPGKVATLLFGIPHANHMSMNCACYTVQALQFLARYAHRTGPVGIYSHLSYWPVFFVSNFDTDNLLHDYLNAQPENAFTDDDALRKEIVKILVRMKDVYTHWRKLYGESTIYVDPDQLGGDIYNGVSPNVLDQGVISSLTKKYRVPRVSFSAVELAFEALDRLGRAIFQEKRHLTGLNTPETKSRRQFEEDFQVHLAIPHGPFLEKKPLFKTTHPDLAELFHTSAVLAKKLTN